MKRLLLFLSLILMLPMTLLAQKKTLELYYIAHDHYETTLADHLDIVRRNARFNEDRTVIFYLADGHTPHFFRVSPEDEERYVEFIESLTSQTSHNVYPDEDRLYLIDILSGGRTISTKGFDAYDAVIFNYYINESFVMMDYCDALIGRLFWDMDMAALPKNKLEINIYHQPDSRMVYKEEKMFGRKNLLKGFSVLIDSF